MKHLVLLVAFLIAAQVEASTASPYGGFESSSSMLILGRLKTLSRSDDPLVIEQSDGSLLVSNGCGYDTAMVKISEQLSGSYRLPELATHLELGEFCNSILQEQVRDYLLALRWNGVVWAIDPELSSRLIPDRSGDLWLVEPGLITLIESAGGPKARPVSFDPVTLENIAIGQERRRVSAEPDESHAEWVEELRRLRPVDGEWPDNPLYFSKGISVSELRAWLAGELTREVQHPGRSRPAIVLEWLRRRPTSGRRNDCHHL